MFILPLNEDLPTRAPLVNGCVANGYCSQKHGKHRAPDGTSNWLGAVEVPLHHMWHLWHPPFKGAFPSWEPHAAPTSTSQGLLMVLHLLLQDPLGKRDEPSTGVVTARVSFHLLTCVFQVPPGLALLCLAALRGRCRGADRHVWGDSVSQLPRLLSQ